MTDIQSKIRFRREIEIDPWGKVIIEIFEGKGDVHDLQIVYDGDFPESYRRKIEAVLRKKDYLKNLSVIKIPGRKKFQ